MNIRVKSYDLFIDERHPVILFMIYLNIAHVN